jgi:hypothetical protein
MFCFVEPAAVFQWQTDNDGSVIKLCSVNKRAEQKFGKVSCSILGPSKGAIHAGIGGKGEEVGETSE